MLLRSIWKGSLVDTTNKGAKRSPLATKKVNGQLKGSRLSLALDSGIVSSTEINLIDQYSIFQREE